jgi:hypothetical protein
MKQSWKLVGSIVIIGILIFAVSSVINYSRSGTDQNGKIPPESNGETSEQYSESGGVMLTQITRAVRFQYPSSYILTEKEVGNAERTHYVITLIKASDAQNGDKENAEGPRAITFDFFQNKEKLTPEQWVKQSSFSNFKLSHDGMIERLDFGGKPAVSYIWDGLYSGKSLVTTTSGDILVISVTYDGNTDARLTDYKSILSTVEFIGIVR